MESATLGRKCLYYGAEIFRGLRGVNGVRAICVPAKLERNRRSQNIKS
jgi:hypothetical protein